MRAAAVSPGRGDGWFPITLPEPPPTDGAVLVETIAVGVCGTDLDVAHGHYGAPPAGSAFLVAGHECVGRVVAGPVAGPAPGELVVPIVRRPMPNPCPQCAVGAWDMCSDGRYLEHGIRGLPGFARERFRLPADRLVRIAPQLAQRGVLVEPASIVVKAWEQLLRVAGRGCWEPRSVLVAGAGPVGLLAALIGTQLGLEVHVADPIEDDARSSLVADLGATYHPTGVGDVPIVVDAVVEATGVAEVIAEAVDRLAPNGVLCLTGVGPAHRSVRVDAGALSRQLVLGNRILLGSVNANRRHYEQAARRLAGCDPQWLDRLLTRSVPMARLAEAASRRRGDIKVVLDIAGARPAAPAAAPIAAGNIEGRSGYSPA